MEELFEILEDIRSDVDFHTETELVDGGILGSFDILSIIGDISDAFDVEISPVDIVPDNFNSANAMWELIQRLK